MAAIKLRGSPRAMEPVRQGSEFGLKLGQRERAGFLGAGSLEQRQATMETQPPALEGGERQSEATTDAPVTEPGVSDNGLAHGDYLFEGLGFFLDAGRSRSRRTARSSASWLAAWSLACAW